MSLPQRKKSAEEIAKLRESLGIGGFPVPGTPEVEGGVVPAEAVPAVSTPPAEPNVVRTPAPPEVVAAPASPEPFPPPAAGSSEPKAVHSLKRSERVPVLHADPHRASPFSEADPVATPAVPLVAGKAPKIVRSLRKSEQIPLPAAHAPPRDSSLPIHRHSDQELGEIRRREMLSHATAGAPPPVLSAHPAVYSPAYALVLGSAAAIWFYGVPLPVPASCAAVALLIATFIFVRKPLSRHHAAFIVALSLFLIIFGALYYFPQLQHGT